MFTRRNLSSVAKIACVVTLSFVKRFASGGALNAPWGFAVALPILEALEVIY